MGATHSVALDKDLSMHKSLDAPSLRFSANELITHARHNTAGYGGRKLREHLKPRQGTNVAKALVRVCSGRISHGGPCSTTLNMFS